MCIKQKMAIEAALEMIKQIRRSGIKNEVTLREIWRPEWSKLISSDEVRVGFNVLIEYDRLTVKKEQTGEAQRNVYG